MELCEGEDLAARLQCGAAPLDEAIGIAKQIAEALEQAHEKGIVHRDLKPANVKLTPEGKVKVIPQVSADGKWLAYLLDRAGPSRIVVRPFPEVERREWVVSGPDAYDPRWSPRGDALLFREGWGRLMSVPVGRGEFAPGVARQLIETDLHDAQGSSFALSPDGTRVLVNKPVGVSLRDETPLTLVTGWAREVSRLVPRAGGQ